MKNKKKKEKGKTKKIKGKTKNKKLKIKSEKLKIKFFLMKNVKGKGKKGKKEKGKIGKIADFRSKSIDLSQIFFLTSHQIFSFSVPLPSGHIWVN